jgi:hypothetical protein
MLRFAARTLALVVTVVNAGAAIGCAPDASPEEVGGSDGAALTRASSCLGPAPTARPITLSLEEVGKIRCRAIMGAFLSLDWHGNGYIAYVADTLDECNATLDAIRAAAWPERGLRAVALERCNNPADGHVVWERDLVIDSRWTLTSVTRD